MNVIRKLIAVLAYISGMSAMVSLVAYESSWSMYFYAVFSLIVAHIIWPSSKRGKYQHDQKLYDLIELFIEFPAEIILWIFRALRKILFGSGSSGLDL